MHKTRSTSYPYSLPRVKQALDLSDTKSLKNTENRGFVQAGDGRLYRYFFVEMTPLYNTYYKPIALCPVRSFSASLHSAFQYKPKGEKAY